MIMDAPWTDQNYKRKRRQSREADVFFSASHNKTETDYHRRVDELSSSYREFMRQHKKEMWEVHRSLGAIKQTDSLAFADARRKTNFHLAAVKARRDFASMPPGMLKREPKLMNIAELQQWHTSTSTSPSQSIQSPTDAGNTASSTTAKEGGSIGSLTTVKQMTGKIPNRRHTFPAVSTTSSSSLSHSDLSSRFDRRRSSAGGLSITKRYLEPINTTSPRGLQRSKTSIGHHGPSDIAKK